MRSVQVNSGNASEQRITEDFYLTAFCPQVFFYILFSLCYSLFSASLCSPLLSLHSTLFSPLLSTLLSYPLYSPPPNAHFSLSSPPPQAHLTVHDVLHSFPRLCQSGQEELVPLPLILQLADSHIPKVVCSNIWSQV